ncbi:multicopper oxidase family protein [Goodfellowiella coeruleoviolacea]|uniref:Multicopper oxidase with three cupredoxin domains (Includes cell division protein FtsP and spore coat protein CotA) n=1 Tax=Goodfellowiella coeruleoviolacea TaxID=334858 RepID=A0AAE3KFZ3_9PSEU|nr:multicopper oxidase domain-containing protein [Goodfellowiella coeruleoviolacea]MCP2164929.1 Multicopper oxidase with three cupredoxin domains (includes cell division protein FtsP and spore coat protein CotA) [Goodfellowiella coeruleoviolacea]
MRRRNFLALTGLFAGLALTGCGGADGNTGTLGFRNALRIPPLLDPAAGADGVRRFDLRLRQGRSEFLPGKSTPTWGVNGDYLGPTLRARRGDRVAMAVTNEVGEPTTLHWHGMRLPARMDGGPHQTIQPGGTWSPEWTVDQPAATTWYHPHPHGTTSQHVYRGLAGLFLLDDDHEVALPKTYGTDDIPLVIQDKKFTEDGRLDEDFGGTYGLLGDQLLVNGTYDPHFQVTTTRVRFRVLNGSNAHVYHLGFADNRVFHVVASDAGLLARPAPVDRLRISPGERFEIVVGFAPGEQVLLKGFSGDEEIDRGDYDILRLVAAAQLAPSAELPQVLTPLAPPAVGATVRRFRLGGTNINGREMDMARIDEVIPAGAHEVWEVDNITFAHNFHIHDAVFRVLDVDGEEPPEHLRGPKDTVFSPGKTLTRLAVEFGNHVDPAMPYMYHCHILRHEDRGMMGQFVIVEPGTENSTPRELHSAGHH